jgi:arylsulfatase A-like enzyme
MTATLTDSNGSTSLPNVIIVLTDDQGYGDVACHGNPHLRTPHLDRLHEESTRFTNFHVAPTCSPTRASLLTGHFHNSTGVWHTIGGRSLLRQDERTLANVLSDAGYVNGLFGKWHLGDAYPYRPRDRGFHHAVTHGGGGIGNTSDYWGNNYVDDHYCHNGTWEHFDGYCTDVWFRLALDFISHHRDRPFFCMIATNAPHLPHIVPEHYSRFYRDLAESDPATSEFFNYPASDQMLKFYGMIASIDENVGMLRDRLDQWALAENTIVVYATDNGSAGGLVCDQDRFVLHGYNAGMRGGKATPYEGGHRVPFFLHWPAGNLATGRDVTTLTAGVDVVPTLLDLCGIEYPPEAFHGSSLVPLFSSNPPSRVWEDRALVTDSQRLLNPVKWRQSCVMRADEDGEWRLINGRSLYNLRKDPEQRHDIAPDHREVVESMREHYESWWQLVSGRFSEPIPFRLGDPNAPPIVLTSHDWRRTPPAREWSGEIEAYGDDARCVWNQAQVRQGLEWNGHWEVDVAYPGTYRFELRRWPREANLPVGMGIPGEIRPYDDSIVSGYGGGRTLPIQRASIRIAGVTAEASTGPDDCATVFEVDLPAGPAHLEAVFTSDGALEMGAYYVYVEHLPGAH